MRWAKRIVNFCIASAFMALITGAGQAKEPVRLALLIGNIDYDQNGGYTSDDQTPSDRLSDLRNACNDIDLIEAGLIQERWNENTEITKACNVSSERMYKLIMDFAQRYTEQPGAFGFIYYSGHGVQVDDTAYIFGIDATVDIDKIKYRYMHHNRGNLFNGSLQIRDMIVSSIGTPDTGSLFVVIDACRENPLLDILIRERIGVPSAPKPYGRPYPGLKVLYSTSNGETASDGAGGVSVFAKVFESALHSEKTAEHLIRTVVYEVDSETQGAKTQTPEENGSFNKPPPEVCFKAC